MEGIRGQSYTGDIAIDDILFTDGYCVGLCSSVKPNQRVDCGYLGINKDSCVRGRGCCWDNSVPNVPWCFYHPSSCSSINPQLRRDCGWVGISQATCNSKGCCWDGSVPNVPHCFYGPAVPTPFPTTPVPPTTSPPSIWDCNFDTNLCSWNNSKEDDFDWFRQSGSTGSTNTGPSADHTTGSTSGYYMYIETSWQSPNDSAVLLSANVPRSYPNNMCLIFWYHMYGQHVDKLNIYMKDPASSTLPPSPVWTKSGTQGDRWRRGQIEFSSRTDFQFAFQGVRGSGYQGDIALDDMKMLKTDCPTLPECEFETPSICGYKQDQGDTFDWSQGSGNTTSIGTGPPSDHTYGTPFGRYMYIETSWPRKPGDFARLESPAYDPALGDGKCLVFWYHMYGNGIGRLNTYIKIGNALGKAVFTDSGNLGLQWNRAMVTVRNTQSWKVVFEGIRGRNYMGDIAIDDVIVKDGACPPPASCDFENGWCSYSNDASGDDFDWELNKGHTGSSGTGPSTDHTLQSPLGSYLYIEASYPRQKGDTARISSDRLSVSKSYQWCLSFWYHMFGQNMGPLRVLGRYFPKSGRPYTRSLLYIPGANYGDNWLKNQLQVNAADDFQIVFQATVGDSYDSDIAIDDILVTAGNCPAPTPSPSPNPKAVQCKNGNYVSSLQVCDFVNDCGVNDDSDEKGCAACDFEKDLCGWNDTSKGSFDWRRDRGGTPSANTGPTVDHTLGTALGWYMYVEASNGNSYDLGRLESGSLKQSSATCQMNFWYHMYGTGIGSLYVYLKVGLTYSRVLEISGNQGNKWNQATVYIGRRSSPFKIVFEAERSYNVFGDIAVDDISLANCALPPVVPMCQYGQFRCARGSCIDTGRVCDFTDDCGDNSDENNCYNYTQRCNFQWYLCGWTQSMGDDFDWTRARGATASLGTGPMTDHTYGTALGYYLYAESSWPRKQGDKAHLVSRYIAPLAVGDSSCKLRLYYHMLGSDIGSLNVYTRPCNGCVMTQVFSKSGEVGNFWERTEVTLTATTPFQIVIEAVIGKNYQGDISIDDVSLTPFCRPYTGPKPTGPTPTPSRPPTLPPCPFGLFRCTDGSCIMQSLRCDYQNDCSDGLDEASCGTCNFEADQCGWGDNSPGQYQWSRHRGATPSANTGPSVDHTCGNSSCYYMYVEAGGGSFLDTARLTSPNMTKTGPGCRMEFWYHLYGNSYSTMRLKLKYKGLASTLFLVSGNMGNKWLKAVVGLGALETGFQLYFEASKFFSASDMAIDDISFPSCALPPVRACQTGEYRCTRGSCVLPNQVCDFSNDCGDNSDELDRTCATYKERCNFDTSLCGWNQDTDDIFDWTRDNGGTASSGTGPGRDHTTGSSKGYYLYIETSSPRKQNDTARISSITFRSAAASDNCRMRFWYHMFGPHVDTLNVHLRTAVGGWFNTIWSMKGDQGDIWNRAEINITSGVNFQVVIEGKRGVSFQGDIAIDDISFTPGCRPDSTATISPNPPTSTPPPGCNSGEHRCSNGQCINAIQVCDFKKDCSDGSDEATCQSTCNFEKDQCNWVNTQVGDTYDWVRNKGPTPSTGTGPTVDHTTNSVNGYYMYTEVSNRTGFYAAAHLASPLFRLAGKTCQFSFWYHMYGPSIGYLQVYYRRNGRDSQLFSLRGQQGNVWKKGTVSIPKCANDFQVVIKGNHYSLGALGDIAIDDLSFDNCFQPDPPSSCSSNQFRCDSGHCISSSSKCDFETDCCDGSEERNSTCTAYTRCNFENGLCDWTQPTDDKFDWIRQQGTTGSLGTGPSVDHTTNTRYGFYVYIEASSPRKRGDNAYLASTWFKPSSTCRVRWFYHMMGSSMGSLNVYTRTSMSGPLSRVWSVSGNQGNAWKRGEAAISVTSGNFQVVFEGVIGTSYTGDIALDDITFTLDCVTVAPKPSPSPTPGICGAGKFQCTDLTGNKVCLANTKKCDFVPDCSDGIDEAIDTCGVPCEFEKDTCGWVNSVSDNFDWTRHKGCTASSSTGPCVDGDNDKNGYYIYIETSTGIIGNKAVLTSPQYQQAFATCQFKFSYHMYGRTIGRLSVYVKDGKYRTRIWTLAGDQGNKWTTTYALIGRRSSPFTIEIEASRGISFQGDISLDNLAMVQCGPPPTCSTPSAGYVKCTNGGCIQKSKLCDFTDDCGDNSDEGRCALYPARCNFETDLCNWQQLTDDDTDWTRMKGATPSYNTGPGRDHTLGTTDGYYIYLETSTGRYGDNARLASPPLQGQCSMRFFYHMFGQHVNSLNVYLRFTNDGFGNRIMNVSGEVGDLWNRAEVVVNPGGKPFQVIIEAVRGRTYLGDIAIDDISFTPSCSLFTGSLPTSAPTLSPPPTTAAPNNCNAQQFGCVTDGKCIPLTSVCDFNVDCLDGSDERSCPSNCTFETGQCGWVHDKSDNDNYDWIRRQGRSPSWGTGPSVDHTLGTRLGYYMYIEASSGSFGQRARLLGPRYQKSHSDCRLEFWYHMWGSTIGDLSVYVNVSDSLRLWWYKSGDQGNKWQKGVVGIGKRTQPFQLLFQARRGRSFSGDIAIDDLQFVGCELPPYRVCTRSQFRCTRGSCTSSDNVCDFSDDCGDSSDERSCSSYNNRCDFTSGLCKWKQSAEDDFDWSRTRGNTASLNTGPPGDHTTGSGYYMYIETSWPRKYGDRAWLVSSNFRAISPSNTDCKLRFWYHMYGDTVEKLNVYIRTFQNGSVGTPVSTLVGAQGSIWRRQVITLTSDKDFQVVIEGVRGDSYDGDIALDDISFTTSCVDLVGQLPVAPPPTPTPKPPVTPVSTCSSAEFNCVAEGPNACILSTQVCDFSKNCKDGSDEKNCVQPSCDFSSGSFCGWYPDNPGRRRRAISYAWVVAQGSTSTQGTGPSTDHTTGTANGWYAYTDASAGSPGDVAPLKTPRIGMSGPECAINFWYHMTGSSVGTLSVKLQFLDGTSPVIWSRTGNQGDSWLNAKVLIGSRQLFQIVLESKRSNGNQGDIAVDDVKLENCKPLDVTRPCNTDEFKCSRGGCIPKSYLCDYQADCMFNDLSDESKCDAYTTKCDFEHGLCLFTQSQDDKFDWSMGTSGTTSTGTGPSKDHSTNTASGHYMYTETSWPRQPGDNARLNSPVIKAASRDCYLRFFYHMHGNHIGSLLVYTRTSYYQGGISQPLLNITGQQGDFWYRAVVKVPTSNSDYQFVIEGVRGISYQGDIAIDDVSMTPSCQICPDCVMPGQPTSTPFGFHTRPTASSCLASQYVCANSKCVDRDQLCNFKDDCGDNSDELPCGTSCTFEGDCYKGWRQAKSSDNFNWIRRQGQTPSIGTGPSMDHTLGTNAGYYMYIETSFGNQGDKAELTSYEYYASSPNCKMSVWYHMYGQGIGTLSFKVKKPDGTYDVQYTLSGNQGNSWKKAVIGLGSYKKFVIIIEATRGANYQGDIAVDDISFDKDCFIDVARNCTANEVRCKNSGHCVQQQQVCDFTDDCGDGTDEDPTLCASRTANCNFEKDWCSFYNWYYDDFDWVRGKAPTGPGTGPKGDHTTGSGQLLYIDSSSPRQPYDRARLASNKLFPASRGVCTVRFYYSMYGSASMGILKMYVMFRTGYYYQWRQAWSARGDFKNQNWIRAEVPISMSRAFYIGFEATVGGDDKTDIALDDISFSAGCYAGGTPAPPTGVYKCQSNEFYCSKDDRCINIFWKCDGESDCTDGEDEQGCATTAPVITPSLGPPHPGDCNFEKDMCLWTSATFADMAWSRNSGRTPSWNTGPSVDHTTGSAQGYYVYAETSPNMLGHFGELLGPNMMSSSSCMIHFCYHMYGAGMGTLNVYIRNTLDPQPDDSQRLIWNTTGDHGDKWFCQFLDIPSQQQYSIVFESIRGRTYQSDIALDDIKFVGCPTQLGPTPAPTPTPKPSIQNEDFEDCVSCWSNDQSGHETMDWQIGRGSTSTLNTGPSYDHTTKTIYGRHHCLSSGLSCRYLYIEASGASAWAHADLESRKLTVSKRCFMTFWYHMYGSSVGQLYAGLYVIKDPNNPAVKKEVYMMSLYGNQGNKWQQAKVNLNSPSDHGLQAQVFISAYRGYDYSGDIAIDDIKFYNCKFLNPTKPCDNTFPNCDAAPIVPPTLRPGSVDCTFEAGFCHWNNSAVADMPWYLREGKTASTGTGPSADHTTGTPNGYYLHIEASWFSKGSVAILEGPYMLPTSYCSITFFYHMFGGDCGSLLVYVYSGGDIVQVFNETGDHGDRWINANINIKSQYAFRIHIVATRGSSYKGDIALDDITFAGQCSFTDETALTYGQNALTTGVPTGQPPKTSIKHPTRSFLKLGLYFLQVVPTADEKASSITLTWLAVRANGWVPRACGRHVSVLTHAVTMSEAGAGSVTSPPSCALLAGVCGTYGDIFEIQNRTTGFDCQTASYAQLSAAINHCKTKAYGADGCTRAVTGLDYGCDQYHKDCSEPLCCGLTCGGSDICDSGVFPKMTRYVVSKSNQQGCRYIDNSNVGGVMCCKDDKTTPTIAPTSAPTAGSCNFENGYCGWVGQPDPANSRARFMRYRGETPYRNTGPRYDHTKEDSTGFYVYMPAYRMQPREKATITSPQMTPVPSNCRINFWYHMYGTGMGVLTLNVNIGGNSTKMFEIGGNQGDGWLRGTAVISNFNTQNKPFTVSFVGSRGPTAYGDIALDDISFTGCNARPGTCNDDQFQCRASKICIKSSFVCDGVPDCNDHSDEDDCPNSDCNLEQIYCPVSQKCLNRTLQCDGKPDCSDYSDEAHCRVCSDNYCKNQGACAMQSTGIRKCICPLSYTGVYCETKIPSDCSNDEFKCPEQPSGCAGRGILCSTQMGICGYDDDQIKRYCGVCYPGYCSRHGTCSSNNGTRTCKCSPSWSGSVCSKLNITCPAGLIPCAVGDNGQCENSTSVCSNNYDCGLTQDQLSNYCPQILPSQAAQTGRRQRTTYIAVGVAGGILLIIVVLIVAYFLTKGRRKKLHLFNVFYDPTKQDQAQMRGAKGGPAVSEGVGNPVYDSFQEGTPLEEFQMSDVDTNMFVSDDAFGMPTEKAGGPSSMANPLYQDPYLEEDLSKY
ncbi:predicted protein [Nematostella vectensis]|uniref:MAM and LDL-receptor class A domain-containing protein n=1 Tax=Nematostella vectensis TaxID=45351 RepID=A7RL31_NEMVE|nr:predicted protein [Nematostella vectensis]|eukprot:XP_001639851.1 predicted protein [Nematostella vectensis]